MGIKRIISTIDLPTVPVGNVFHDDGTFKTGGGGVADYKGNAKGAAVNAPSDGVADAGTAINNYVNTTLQITGSIGGEVFFPEGKYLFSTDIQFPNNVRLTLPFGARLVAANGVTVKLPPNFNAGPYQVFETQGTGRFIFVNDPAPGANLRAGGYPPVFYPEWWGAKGDNVTDNLAAFNKLQDSMQAIGFSGAVRAGTVLLTGSSYYMSARWTIKVPMKITSPTTSDVEGADFGFRFPANTAGIYLQASANGAELSGFGIMGAVNDAQFNTLVSTTSGSMVMNLVGGAITAIHPREYESGSTTSQVGVMPGSTIYLNGYNYILADFYQGTGNSSPTLIKPRLILGRGGGDGLAANQLQNASSYMPEFALPNNNDWAGQTVKINGDSTYSIVSHTSVVMTLNKDIPAGAYNLEVQGIRTQTGAAARINRWTGLDIGAQIKVKSVFVSTFAGVGIGFYSDHAPFPPPYATMSTVNNATAERIVSRDSRGSGIVFYGYDSNNITTHLMDAQQSRGVGIFEGGTLGSNHYGYHLAWNHQGAASFFSAVADNMLSQGYTEGGQPPIWLGGKTMAIGGDNQAGFDPDSPGSGYLTMVAGKISAEGGIVGLNNAGRTNLVVVNPVVNTFGTAFRIGVPSYAPNTVFSFGSGEEGISAGLGRTDVAFNTAFDFHYNNLRRGWYSLLYNGFKNTGTNDASNIFAVSGEKAFEGPGKFWLLNEFFAGSSANRRKWGFVGSIPTTGSVAQGDIFWNKNGGGTAPIGWIATAAGSLSSTPQNFSVNATGTKTVTLIDISSNQITIPSNGLPQSAVVRVSSTGAMPSPLLADTDYIVKIASPDIFYLTRSQADWNVNNFIDLTSTGSGTITVSHQTQELTSAAHGFANGTVGQLTTTTGGTLPAGLSPGTNCYIFGATADKYKLANSQANAEAGISVATFTNGGTGTHTFAPTAGALIPISSEGGSNERAKHTGTQGLSTISGITASRLLGRTTAGFGAAEEISIGSNLQLSGGTLSATFSGITGNQVSAPASDASKDTETGKYLRWKIHGNNHVIIDASAGTSPAGTTIPNNNAQNPWTATHPTLVGWNGANTYGVRVDSARVADNAATLQNSTLANILNRGSHIGEQPIATVTGLETQLAKISDEYLICKPSSGTDITAKLNEQIALIKTSGVKGGKIYIPNGAWTVDGGFDVPAGTIEGNGKSVDTGAGTRLSMNQSSPHNYMFGIGGGSLMGIAAKGVKDPRIRNLEINMGAKAAGHGILITNSPGFAVYGTKIENVLIHYGAGGTGTALRVDAPGGVFECILMNIQGCDFKAAGRAFYCNTNNSGFTFKNIYSASLAGQIALDINIIGNLHVNDWVAVGSSAVVGTNFQNDGTIFLKTFGAYNNIILENCQNELMEFVYKNDVNPYPRKAITWRNNLIQGKMLFSSAGSLIDENNTWVNFAPTAANPNGYQNIIDGGTGSNEAWVHLYRVGKNYVESRDANDVPQPNPRYTNFNNPYSRIIDTQGNINPLKVVGSAAETQTVNASRGVVKVAANAVSVQVFNNLVDASSVINTFKMAFSDATIKGVVPNNGFFLVYFGTVPTAEISIGFEVLNPVILEAFEAVR